MKPEIQERRMKTRELYKLGLVPSEIKDELLKLGIEPNVKADIRWLRQKGLLGYMMEEEFERIYKRNS